MKIRQLLRLQQNKKNKQKRLRNGGCWFKGFRRSKRQSESTGGGPVAGAASYHLQGSQEEMLMPTAPTQGKTEKLLSISENEKKKQTFWSTHYSAL